MKIYSEHQDASGLLTQTSKKIMSICVFLGGTCLAIPLLFSTLLIFRNRWIRFAYLTIIVYLIGAIAVTWFKNHYAAPVVCLIFLLAVQGFRILFYSKIHRKAVGKWIVSVLLLICIALFFRDLGISTLKKYRLSDAWFSRRAQMLEGLEKDGGRHLIIVRYGDKHNPHYEWVHNEADIDNAPVVWAREMDGSRNRKLLEYFKDRHVWLLEIDDDFVPVKLLPYPGSREK